MTDIRTVSVTFASPPDLLRSAQSLFRSYADFLRSISACHGFQFDRFNEEILALPTPYTEYAGELLLAFVPSHPTHPAGAIAYRTAPATHDSGQPTSSSHARTPTCELKRLFVLPEHRGQHVGRHLISAALTRAHESGFRRAILDTDPTSMLAALHLYRQLGFTEYGAAATEYGAAGQTGVLLLEKHLG